MKIKDDILTKSKTPTLKNRTLFRFILVLLVLGSCEKETTRQEKTFYELQGENGFVGMVDGTNAFVAILLGEQEGMAYLCNGDEAFSEWFSGSISTVQEINFTNNQGAKITASLIDTSFQGELSLKDGSNFSFNASVNNEVYGGIYRVIDEKAEKSEIEASWIVRSEMDQRGSITFQSLQLPNISLSKKNFEDIRDGTSNTVGIKGVSFSIFRYQVKKTLSPVPPVPIPYPITSD